MYGTLANWRAHATERGDAAPSDASDVDADAALVRARDYIRAHYVLPWRGSVDPLPAEIEEATYIAAGLEMKKPGLFSKVYTPGERKVLTEVSGIKWEVLPSAGGKSVPVSPLIEALLMPYRPVRLPAFFVV